MGSFNKVVLLGNLTRDVELKQLPSGTAVADMGLAVNEKFRNKDGETVESTCFVDLVAWDRQAELCGTYLQKGSGVLVEGRLQYDKWETDDGQKRSRLRVRADRVQFLSRTRGANGDGNGASEEPDMPF
jgi:single-strand DNA-binding protein